MRETHTETLGKRLRQEREIHHWTQEQLAKKIGGSVPSINRWEHDRATPRQELLTLLTEAFGRPPEQWGTARQIRWNVPFLRNPYFTGRGHLLERLHQALAAESTVALSQAHSISGMGGIGKTQTAIEYAYRYAYEYEAVLWIRADSFESLVSDFAALAPVLDLPTQQEHDQHYVVSAVKQWLQQHSSWLLIFDNADDPTLISGFLPSRTKGAILLTTRSQAMSPHIKKIRIDKMSREEGIDFLLRRIRADEELQPAAEMNGQAREEAGELWEFMGGLPLALDQAAAYIEETGCTLSDYLALFRTHSKQLLHLRGRMATAHPESAATTLWLAFEKVEQANPAAAELLRFCAFLHPDEISEAMIIAGASMLGPVLQSLAAEPFEWNTAIGVLRRYSMVKRVTEKKILHMHRLVQAIIRDNMDEATRQQWAERTVLVVNRAFPEPPFVEWTQCERLLPHILVCATWIEQKPALEASSLLDKAGSYLREQGQYKEAKRLLEAAISIRQQHPEAEDLLATSLSNLAGLLSYQGKYAEAEQLVERAYSIRKRVLGSGHPDTATSLSHLANLSTLQGKSAQAETWYEQALLIYQQNPGADPRTVAKTMGNLAVLYEEEGKYKQAEQLNKQMLSIYEQHLEATHPAIARALSNLALILWQLGKYEEAKALFERALFLQESEFLDAAYSRSGLAEIAREQREYEQAEKYYEQVLAIREHYLEAEHPDRAAAYEGMADVYREQKRCAEAEQLYQRAQRIWEQQFGPDSLQMTRSLTGLAHLAREQGKYAEAEHLYLHALHIHEREGRLQHPNTAETTDGLAQLREIQGDRDGAKSLYIHTLAIREQALGTLHPKTTKTWARLIDLLRAMGQHEEVARLEATQEEL